ncbi:MAG: replication initiator [Acidimicrobiales bacterium]
MSEAPSIRVLSTRAMEDLTHDHDEEAAASLREVLQRQVLTKSRRYSTTFSSLRRARYEHQVEMARRRGHPGGGSDAELVVGHWRYGGSGYGLPSDHLVAEMLARSTIEARAEGWAVREMEPAQRR